MKLAGPYWMSCVTKNDALPILAPDHYPKCICDLAMDDAPRGRDDARAIWFELRAIATLTVFGAVGPALAARQEWSRTR
jgi:hypothetical protein